MKDWPSADTQSAIYSLEHKEQNALYATVNNLASDPHCRVTPSSLAVMTQAAVLWYTDKQDPNLPKPFPPYPLW